MSMGSTQPAELGYEPAALLEQHRYHRYAPLQPRSRLQVPRAGGLSCPHKPRHTGSLGSSSLLTCILHVNGDRARLLLCQPVPHAVGVGQPLLHAARVVAAVGTASLQHRQAEEHRREALEAQAALPATRLGAEDGIGAHAQHRFPLLFLFFLRAATRLFGPQVVPRHRKVGLRAGAGQDAAVQREGLLLLHREVGGGRVHLQGGVWESKTGGRGERRADCHHGRYTGCDPGETQRLDPTQVPVYLGFLTCLRVLKGLENQRCLRHRRTDFFSSHLGS